MDTKLGKVQTYKWGTAILKAIWPFDYVKFVRSHYNLKILYFHYQWTWQGANLWEEVQHANA